VSGPPSKLPVMRVRRQEMMIDTEDTQACTVEQVRRILQRPHALDLGLPPDDSDRYARIGAALLRLNYLELKRPDRGLVLAYLQRLSGYSRAQVTRIVSRWMAGKPLAKNYRPPAHAFEPRYTPSDVELLAEVDRAMGVLSGPVTACILRRQRDAFGDARFARLGSLSVGHLYNLRRSCAYAQQRPVSTRIPFAKALNTGARTARAEEGRPGFIRIDTLHHHDFDGAAGLYLVSAVDCITQWQVVAAVQTLSEGCLRPAIEEMAAQFPFEVVGFRAPLDREPVYTSMTGPRGGRRTELTPSRPRKGNHDAPAEPKGRTLERQDVSSAPDLECRARRFNTFCAEFLNPFLNFHVPRLSYVDVPDPKRPGRIKRVCRKGGAMTPLDKLTSIPETFQHLRDGTTLEHLHQLARALSDLQAAQELNEVIDEMLLGGSGGEQPRGPVALQ
jgi:hypothetical protein